MFQHDQAGARASAVRCRVCGTLNPDSQDRQSGHEPDEPRCPSWFTSLRQAATKGAEFIEHDYSVDNANAIQIAEDHAYGCALNHLCETATALNRSPSLQPDDFAISCAMTKIPVCQKIKSTKKPPHASTPAASYDLCHVNKVSPCRSPPAPGHPRAADQGCVVSPWLDAHRRAAH